MEYQSFTSSPNDICPGGDDMCTCGDVLIKHSFEDGSWTSPAGCTGFVFAIREEALAVVESCPDGLDIPPEVFAKFPELIDR